MKNRSSIKNKVLILLGIMFLLLIANSVWSIKNFKKLNDSIANIMDANYLSVVAAQQMSLTVERQDSLQLSYIFTKNESYIKEFVINKDNFYKWLGREKNNITEPGEKELVDKIEYNYEDYIYKFIEFSEIKDVHEAQNFYFKEIFPIFEKLKGNFRDLLELNQNSMLVKRDRAATISSEAALSTTLLCCSTILIGLLLSSFMTNKIFWQLKELIEKINKISQGDYSQKLHPPKDKELIELSKAFNTMSEELSTYKMTNIRKLMAEKSKTEAVVENIEDGIIVTDLENKILLINKAAKYFLNITEEQEYEGLIGKHFLSVIPNQELFKKINDFLVKDSYNVRNKEFEFSFNNKEEIYTKIIINSIVDKENKYIGIVTLIQNITKQKKIDNMKSEFVATVSHEFKTPLTSMGMAIGMLSEKSSLDTLTEYQAECLNIIRQDNERLNCLIKDLLDLSKLEAGKVVMNIRNCSVRDIIEFAAKPLENLCKSNNIKFDFSDINVIHNVAVDFNKISWVLTNLLTNAIKYRDNKKESYIILRAYEKNDKVVISVEDNGIGIPEEFHEKIFNKFIRVSVSDDGKVTGTGLGLSISKSIMKAHNGKIGVESKEGVGSIFYIELNYINN